MKQWYNEEQTDKRMNVIGQNGNDGEHYKKENNMKNYKELEAVIELWAEEKGILSKATPIKQAMKTQEECLELCNAILNNDTHEIKDAIGDIIVTLIIQAKMQEMTIEECLNAAYDVISKRTGKMINGQFVKDK